MLTQISFCFVSGNIFLYNQYMQSIRLINIFFSEIGACDFSPCLNNGTCVTDTSGQSSCQCQIPYLGAYCEGKC